MRIQSTGSWTPRLFDVRVDAGQLQQKKGETE
jgi:hypothetical protein